MTEDLERRLRDVAATAPRPATDADRVASILIRAQHRRRRRLAGGFAAAVALVALGFGIRNVDTPVTRVATDPAGEPTATSEPVPAQPTTSTVESSTTTLSLAGSTPASPTSAAPQSTVVETVNLVPGTDKAACVRADVTGAVIAQSPGGRLWAVMDQSIGVSDDGGGTWRWGCGRAPYNASRLSS